MDDMDASVPREAAARIVRACRALMLAGWAMILLVLYFAISETFHPGLHFFTFVPLAVLLVASFFLLSSRCPRCHREFFADEKTGFGVMFGRFTCVACGYDPTTREGAGELP
jgi:ribosomal protein S27AE